MILSEKEDGGLRACAKHLPKGDFLGAHAVRRDERFAASCLLHDGLLGRGLVPCRFMQVREGLEIGDPSLVVSTIKHLLLTLRSSSTGHGVRRHHTGKGNQYLPTIIKVNFPYYRHLLVMVLGVSGSMRVVSAVAAAAALARKRRIFIQV